MPLDDATVFCWRLPAAAHPRHGHRSPPPIWPHRGATRRRVEDNTLHLAHQRLRHAELQTKRAALEPAPNSSTIRPRQASAPQPRKVEHYVPMTPKTPTLGAASARLCAGRASTRASPTALDFAEHCNTRSACWLISRRDTHKFSPRIIAGIEAGPVGRPGRSTASVTILPSSCRRPPPASIGCPWIRYSAAAPCPSMSRSSRRSRGPQSRARRRRGKRVAPPPRRRWQRHCWRQHGPT